MPAPGSSRWRRFAAVSTVAGVSVVLLGAHAPAIAQQISPNTQTHVREQTDRFDRVTGAGAASSTAAEQKREFEGAPNVTLEDVQRDPNNVELNFDFARNLAARGDFRGAAEVLARILAAYPQLAHVRLFYGVMLYRLNFFKDAERELSTISTLEIPESLRQEIQTYLDRIAFVTKPTHYSASLSFGGAYDSNRNFAPRSGQSLVNNTVVDVADSQREHSGKGFLSIGTFRVRHDLGFEAKHEAFGGVTIFRDDQLHLNEQNLQSYVFDGGGTFRSEWVNVTINPAWSKLRLADQSFYDSYGGRLRLEKRVDEIFEAYAEYQGVYEKFRAITFSPTSTERTGGRHDVRLGVNWTLQPNIQLNFEYNRTRKDARKSFNAYDAHTLTGNMTYLMDGGQFLLLTATGERDQYDDPDLTVSDRTRQDTIMRYRATYGAPLGFFADLVTGEQETLPSYIADITFTGALEWLDSASNIKNYDYSNLKAQFLLTKRWEF